ncbi:MAG: BBP7 family outer membrane beta-barrel protein, partial [Planctomycetota bacterium]
RQRWYDISAEATVLFRNSRASNQAITGQGGPGTAFQNIVLRANDADTDDPAAGLRLSGAFITGPGANVEVTYSGLNEWTSTATVTSANPDLQSFISDFARTPNNGFDDSDRSLTQSITSESLFHSGEVNYRRRTVAPNCSYQGSWLVGLRYFRFDDDLIFRARGQLNNAAVNNLRFLDLAQNARNSYFGVQAGGDFWLHLARSWRLGVEGKVGVLELDADRELSATSNSLGPGATPGSRTVGNGASETTTFGEIIVATTYRFSHSWNFRASYNLIAIDEAVFGGTDFDVNQAIALRQPGVAVPVRPIDYDSLVLQGFTFGAEYTW